VLVKPFEPQMVISRVRDLLARRPRQAAGPAAEAPAVEPVEPSELAASAAPPAAPLPPAPAPAAGQSAGKPDALEDYFDRLDAALSTANTVPPPLEPVPDELRAKPAFATSAEAAAGKRSSDAPVASAVTGATNGMPPLHEAFAALLSAERGQPLHPNGPTREAITEDVIEEVVRRVLARMSNDAMRRAVLDTAERLVREEIERIKKSS
jgi:hypothetical protein